MLQYINLLIFYEGAVSKLVVTRQLDGEDFKNIDLKPFEISMAVMKEIGLVYIVDYISNNIQYIVSGFLYASISEALDGKTDNDTCTQL